MAWFDAIKSLLKISPDAKTTAFVLLAGSFIWQNTTSLVEAKHAQGLEAIREQQKAIREIIDANRRQIEIISEVKPKIDSLEKSVKRIDDWVLELYRYTIPKNERKNRNERNTSRDFTGSGDGIERDA